jgi:hypothetical protein
MRLTAGINAVHASANQFVGPSPTGVGSRLETVASRRDGRLQRLLHPYEHGVYIAARHLAEAAENLARVDSLCRAMLDLSRF